MAITSVSDKNCRTEQNNSAKLYATRKKKGEEIMEIIENKTVEHEISITLARFF